MDDVTRPMSRRGSGRILGPFLLREPPIDVGGMGSVHEADMLEDRHYAKCGERVAVKILDEAVVRARGGFQRFLREGAIGRAVRSPHLVRVLDLDAGVLDGSLRHYVVMELLQGRSLFMELRDRGVLEPEEMLALARSMALALGALHGAGVIHRDVKPGNIMVLANRGYKLLDLGTARSLDPELIVTSADRFVGTECHASPEQLTGRPLGPATDFYSLGVVLYEAATGSRPFRAQDIDHLLHCQLHEAVPSTRGARVDLPEALHQIIASLLDKDPQARLGSSEAMLALLDGRPRALLAVPSERGHAEPPRSTTFVGREPELRAMLAACVDETRAGHVLLVEGSEGMGRTRLLRQVADQLRQADASQVVLFSPGETAPVPGTALGSALVAAFGRQSFIAQVSRHLSHSPGAVHLLAAAVGVAEAMAPADHELAAAALVQLVRSLSKTARVTWLIDDAHALTSFETRLVRALAAATSSCRLTLLMSCRDTLTRDVARDILGETPANRMNLPPLGEPQVEAMAEDIIGSPAAAALLSRRIYEASGGCALLVVELARAVAAERSSAGEAADRGSSVLGLLPTSTTLQELFRRRVESLRDDDRDLVDVAAVAGGRFSASLLAQVLSRSGLSVMQDLWRLSRRDGLVRSVGDDWVFEHAQIREALLDLLPSDLRRGYHAAIAVALADDATPEALLEKRPDLACEVTMHLLLARDAAAAEPYFPQVQHILHERGRWEAALELATVAQEVLPQHAGWLEQVRAEMLRYRGRSTEALSCARRAVDMARLNRDPLSECRGLLTESDILLATGNVPEAEVLTLNALDVARAHGDVPSLVRALRQMATLELRRGRSEQADRLVSEAVDSARNHGQAAALAASLALQAMLRLDHRDVEGAIHAVGEAAGLADATGQRRVHLACVGCEAVTHLIAGDARRAESASRRYMEEAQGLGHVESEANARSYLGEALLLAGALGDARSCLQQALLLSEEAMLPRVELQAASTMAMVEGAEGRLSKSASALESLIRRALSLEQRTQASVLRLKLAGVLMSAGRLDDAAAELSQVSSESSGLPCWVDLHARSSSAELARLLGRSEEALESASFSLARWRELRVPGEIARNCLALGRTKAESGEPACLDLLSEAIMLGETLGLADVEGLACAWRAAWQGVPADSDFDRLSLPARVEALAVACVVPARGSRAADAREALALLSERSERPEGRLPVGSLLARVTSLGTVRRG